jgi:hypothetical protein
MLGGCQRKLGTCQSRVEAKGDQKLKLNETSPQVNLRKCMCVPGIHYKLPCSCGLLLPLFKTKSQSCSKLGGRLCWTGVEESRADVKAGRKTQLDSRQRHFQPKGRRPHKSRWAIRIQGERQCVTEHNCRTEEKAGWLSKQG